MNTAIIGVMGRANAGKDTFCKMAAEILVGKNLRPAIIACADPLKQICSSVFSTALGVPRTAFYGTLEQKEAPLAEVPGWTGREILQHIGTEGFRAVNSLVWSRYMLGRAKELLTNGADVVLVSDVRFISEANAIKEAGGVLVRMRRGSADERPATHSSETDCENIIEDYSIDNRERALHHLQGLVQDFLCQWSQNFSRLTPRPPV